MEKQGESQGAISDGISGDKHTKKVVSVENISVRLP